MEPGRVQSRKQQQRAKPMSIAPLDIDGINYGDLEKEHSRDNGNGVGSEHRAHFAFC